MPPLAATGAVDKDIAEQAAEISAEVDDDKGFITNLLEENLSGAGREVIIDGFRGALSSRATYDQITIADAEGIWLTLKNGAIHWNRAAGRGWPFYYFAYGAACSEVAIEALTCTTRGSAARA